MPLANIVTTEPIIYNGMQTVNGTLTFSNGAQVYLDDNVFNKVGKYAVFSFNNIVGKQYITNSTFIPSLLFVVNNVFIGNHHIFVTLRYNPAPIGRV